MGKNISFLLKYIKGNSTTIQALVLQPLPNGLIPPTTHKINEMYHTTHSRVLDQIRHHIPIIGFLLQPMVQELNIYDNVDMGRLRRLISSLGPHAHMLILLGLVTSICQFIIYNNRLTVTLWLGLGIKVMVRRL